MKKKKNWLGILVLILVFGIMVVGCEEEEKEYTYYFDNFSSHTINISCGDLNPSNFTISSGQRTTATSYASAIQLFYTPKDKVRVEVSPMSAYWILFYDINDNED